MSQECDISGKIRAAVAVAAVWALLFSVMTMGAVNASAATFVENNSSAGAGLFACFKRHMTHQAEAAGEKAPEKRSAGHRHCPDCCLAALAGSAVLPQRIATVAQSIPAPARIAYLAARSHSPRSVLSPALNGARAPPV